MNRSLAEYWQSRLKAETNNHDTIKEDAMELKLSLGY